MHEHIVSAYQDELTSLDRHIAKMGGLCEMLLARGFDALEKRDPGLAREVIELDKQVDELQRRLEENAVLMIARRQPMANDLRQIMASLRVANELERIGDLSKNIAKRGAAIADQAYPRQLVSGLSHMVEQTLHQLKQVLDAYAERDADAAVRVWESDGQIDATYNSVFRELLTYMMEDPRNISHCTHLLFGAKNVERIGDHATNIAENVVFLVRGTPLVDERPKADTTSSTIVLHT
ncbi:MAG: phosphate signaling complex protein PhoU [Pseudomonadota bacterium]